MEWLRYVYSHGVTPTDKLARMRLVVFAQHQMAGIYIIVSSCLILQLML